MNRELVIEEQAAPSRFEVTVVLTQEPVSNNRWVNSSWRVAGVVHGRHLGASAVGNPNDDRARQKLCPGLWLRLHPDEAESYYHNLMAAVPQLYVVTRSESLGAIPDPFHVTASFDEAHAYLEGDDDVHQVPLPEEVLPWIERFVLKYYEPRARRKRRRQDWKEEPPGEANKGE